MAEIQGDPATIRAQARIGYVLREKWRLDGLLGVGGMAAVYAATHRNGKRGAVKMLHLELSSDEEARKRFLREGYVANAVDHPGAVQVLDDDIAEDGSVFLVMELLEGHTVEARSASRPGSKLDPGELLAITDQLLDILVAAHGKGIVHRDLKPENLFLTKTGQVKVLDFGLARLHDLSRGSKGARMTTEGSAMGTPAFMPPEQALGNWDSVDARSDIWAVGATMFNLLTGRFVHEADNVNKLLLAAMTKPARKIATVDPSVPPAVATIIDRALAFEQKDRWPDAATMRAVVRLARSNASGGQFVTLAEGPAPAAFNHPAVQAATQISVEPVQRNPLASSIGPTASEPRLTMATKGAIAGAALAVVLGGALFFAVRAQHATSGATGTPAKTAPEAPPPVTSAAPAAPAGAATQAPTIEPAPSATATVTATATATAAPSATVSAHLPHTKPSSAPKSGAGPKVDPLKNW